LSSVSRERLVVADFYKDARSLTGFVMRRVGVFNSVVKNVRNQHGLAREARFIRRRDRMIYMRRLLKSLRRLVAQTQDLG